MRVRETPAFLRQSIDMRRLHLRRAITTHVPIPEIVGEDENDIGWGGAAET